MRKVRYKDHVGYTQRGKLKIKIHSGDYLSKVCQLIAEVESNGVLGTVMNYDGTGMTAGLLQAIAVYPRSLRDNNSKNDQGPLWKQVVALGEYAHPIKCKLNENGVSLTDDGRVVHRGTGRLVSGRKLLKILTGSPDGNAAPESRGWITAFHEVFSDERTRGAQLGFLARHVEGIGNKRLRYCKSEYERSLTVSGCFLDSDSVLYSQAGPNTELAIAMFFGHSVNAPGFALKKLCRAVGLAGNPACTDEGTARVVIRALGNTPFGRWDDDIKYGRYQRTRKAAMKLWPKELFGKGGIMPEKL